VKISAHLHPELKPRTNNFGGWTDFIKSSEWLKWKAAMTMNFKEAKKIINYIFKKIMQCLAKWDHWGVERKRKKRKHENFTKQRHTPTNI
jgi:hypothetical protein